jgi:4-hydroxy-tetrahydrodipicolinate synthase
MAVIAGTGSYSTDQTLRRTEEAIRDGVDAVMVVAPYYNRPGPRGLREHFLAVAESSPVPVLLYNIPARTGVEMETELLKELADHPRIQALKDATGAPNHAMDVLADSQLAVLCGDDALTLPWLALGATGVVSVAANAVPEEMAALVAEAQLLDWESARKRHYRLLPLFRALTAETNPIPIKALLEILGLCNSEVRLPLVKADEATRLSLRRALGKLRENPQTVAAGAA